MPIRDRVLWGTHNPFSDPRLAHLDRFVKEIRLGRLPPNVTGGSEFRNVLLDLPPKPPRYYREFDVAPVAPGADRGKLRIVLGEGGEVFLTGNHYRDFRQILQMPT